LRQPRLSDSVRLGGVWNTSFAAHHCQHWLVMKAPISSRGAKINLLGKMRSPPARGASHRQSDPVLFAGPGQSSAGLQDIDYFSPGGRLVHILDALGGVYGGRQVKNRHAAAAFEDDLMRIHLGWFTNSCW